MFPRILFREVIAKRSFKKIQLPLALYIHLYHLHTSW